MKMMNNEKIDILDLNQKEIADVLLNMGCERFRAKQIYSWLNKGVNEFDEMTDIKKSFREDLKKGFYINTLKIKNVFISKIDGTKKYLLELMDKNVIESVAMQYKHGVSCCISTQAGCNMGCKFCASSKLGFGRNLTASEMLKEILIMQKDIEKRISNVVLMGIGEPLSNYDNVIKFLKMLNDKDGLNIGYRHISLSTCGLVPEIIKLSCENLPITLSISLHAPNDDIRNIIMPINKKYCIDKLIQACKIYLGATKRRITFEYALIKGINDSKENARELSLKLKGMLCHVNLININNVNGTDFEKTDKSTANIFKSILEKYGIETTLRRELGSDINAACGQLRRSTQE